MFIYVFICMYMHVYAYMHVYIHKRVIYVKNRCDYHSHTGTVAEVITFHRGDGCSRPENSKGVLHHFEYLFASEIPERPSSPALSFPSRAWDARRNENHYIHTYTYIYCILVYVYACILLEYLCLLMYTYV
jgi:hypothetical protein